MTDLMDTFLPALKAKEGGGQFTNRSADKGGPTKYGIDAATLGAWRKLGRPASAAEVQALQEPEADQIFRSMFFIQPGFDQVAAASPRIAEEMVDTGVNMGVRWPGTFLQRSLNLCNRQGKDWPDLPTTGAVGPLTMQALRALLKLRGVRAGEDLILKCLNGFQFERYVEITEAGGPNSSQEQNFVGWISARIGFAT